MGDGCYDENGKCVNCGKFHPCDCEVEVVNPLYPSQESLE